MYNIKITQCHKLHTVVCVLYVKRGNCLQIYFIWSKRYVFKSFLSETSNTWSKQWKHICYREIHFIMKLIYFFFICQDKNGRTLPCCPHYFSGMLAAGSGMRNGVCRHKSDNAPKVTLIIVIVINYLTSMSIMVFATIIISISIIKRKEYKLS